MRFGYEVRPSFWHELKANSHLVIAAAGTAALLGIAGTALWLALPSGDRQAFAEAKPHVQHTAATKAPASPAGTAAPAAPVALAGNGVASSRVAPKADAVRPEPAADLPALKGNDPRWTPSEAAADAGAAAPPAGDGGRPADTAKAVADEAAPAPAGASAGDDGQDGSVAAFAEESADDTAAAPPAADGSTAAHAEPDPKAATAAIPAVQPDKPAAKAAGGNGTILRAVTMRAAPKKHGAAIGTVPAKATVQVVSCASWCEIVYQGKRGFIYKGFLKRGH